MRHQFPFFHLFSCFLFSSRITSFSVFGLYRSPTMARKESLDEEPWLLIDPDPGTETHLPIVEHRTTLIKTTR